MMIKLNFNLKKLLSDSNLTPTQLARETKVPVQSIHNWIHGQKPRSFEQIKKIADYFQISMDELVYGPLKIPTKNQKNAEPIQQYNDEINAGIYEVVLRRVRNKQ